MTGPLQPAGSCHIGGRFVDGTAGENHAVADPSDGSLLADLELAGGEDVDRAVSAAREAFPDWSGATPATRSAALVRLAAILDERAEEFAEAESRQAGKPIRLSTGFDVPGTVDNAAFFAGAARNLEGKAAGEYSGDHTSMIRREAVGVVGSIAPWNYPLQMAAWKILPAIAAGNTIVLKPAEITPLTSLMFAQACVDAGIPDGVVNVLTGRGSVAGAALVGHPDVDMVSFTGSTAVGVQVMQTAATHRQAHAHGARRQGALRGPRRRRSRGGRARRCRRVRSSTPARTARRRPAPTCSGPLYDAFVQGVADVMAGVRLGPTIDPATDQGPLVSRRQQESVAGFVERARGYGAKIVCGGEIPGGELAKGAYYSPTLVVDVGPGLRDRPGGAVRTRARGAALRRRRGGPAAGQRHARTAWPPRSGPATSSGR